MIGLDEVGRGAWAGPLVFAAVSFRVNPGLLDGLDDSKKLSASRRRWLADLIWSDHAVGIGSVSAAEVDQLGLTAASRLACLRALDKFDRREPVLLDGTVNYLAGSDWGEQTTTMIKADATDPVVMAASVVAKVWRDQYMTNLAIAYPQYGFDRHVGYGTAKHRAALRQYGPMAEHRRSYRPLRPA